ncbi:hypothetical protein ACQ4M3_01125 [Leptolyngbya sp. AN03gr2]|uniref:hypothetical protein n=1 Tax=unclassified Leptolyngbya TaxID=2650499 RepID=UPI003D30FFB8
MPIRGHDRSRAIVPSALILFYMRRSCSRTSGSISTAQSRCQFGVILWARYDPRSSTKQEISTGLMSIAPIEPTPSKLHDSLT